ncbi:MAG: enoyl-CoA hydratase [Dehalococcoidia bacterium]|nr:MAG: enoyl-CoA hydratase [Dehalococcoidia bacterium]
MNWETVLYEKVGPVARITLNRPDKRNAQNFKMITELDEAMKATESDDEVRVIVLAGAGPAFSSGHDMSGMAPEGGMAGWRIGGEEHREFEQDIFVDKCLYIRNLPKPTIAQVHGYCLAAGMMLACMCDLIVASEDAIFANMVARMAASGVELLIEPWEVGVRQAKELLFTGDSIDAREAHRLGMVNKVVARDKLEETVMELANKIALMPPVALRLTKKSLNRTQDIQGYTQSMSAHFDIHMLAHGSDETKKFIEDAIEKGATGAKEFTEHRDSKFK